MRHPLINGLLFVILNFIGSSFAFAKIAVFESTNESLNYQLFEGTINVNNEIQPIILILENSENSNQHGFWISNGYYEGRKELIGTFEKNIATYKLNHSDELSISFQVSNSKLIGNWSLRNDDNSLSNFVGDLALNFVMNVQKLPEPTEILKFSNFYVLMPDNDPTYEIDTYDFLHLVQFDKETWLFNFSTRYYTGFSNTFYSGLMKMESANKGVYYDTTMNCSINFEITKDNLTIEFECLDKESNVTTKKQLPIFYKE